MKQMKKTNIVLVVIVYIKGDQVDLYSTTWPDYGMKHKENITNRCKYCFGTGRNPKNRKQTCPNCYGEKEETGKNTTPGRE